METLILIVVKNRYKVYKDCNGKRRLLGTFKNAYDAERFMNARP